MPLSPEQRAQLAEQFAHLPTEMPASRYAVYTLSDPHTGEVRYVGVTRHPRRRLVVHVKKLPANGEKRAWFLDLTAHGVIPTMTLIEEVKGSEADVLRREQKWIERYAAEGASLLNREILRPRRYTTSDGRSSGKVGHAREQGVNDPDVLICERQAEIPWFDSMIVAVRAQDGSIGVTLRSLCNVLGLHYTGQVERVRRREEIASGLLRVRIQTDGGPQVMHVISLRVIPFWLLTIGETRVYDQVREKLVGFQRICVDILAEHFANKPHQAVPAPDTLVPSELITRPERPPTDADRAAWIEYHHAMEAWLRWQDDVDRWRHEHDQRYSALAQRQTELEDRMESVEEVTRLIPEILERLGPETLSPEHQATVKNLAKRLNELAGFSYAAIYGEMNAAFHVGKYSDIPAARWPDVLAWFKARIDAAERPHSQ